MPETELCSKCKENPRADSDSNNPWCKPCRAKYAKEYADEKLTRERSKGFVAGVEAMVQTLATEFGRHGRAQMTCREVEFAIRNSPRPQMPT